MKPMKTRQEANRENAQHSTGPRTAAGKEIAKMNGVKHGLCATQTLVKDEDPAEFAAFREALVADLQPAGAMQAEVVEGLVQGYWVKRRGARVQQEYFARGAAMAAKLAAAGGEQEPSNTPLMDAIAAQTKEFALYLRYVADNNRETEKLHKRLMELQAAARAAQAAQVATITGMESAARWEAAAGVRASSAGGPAALLAHAQLPSPADHVCWADIVQELYWAASAGPQEHHPLPDHYYGSYVIWRKQKLMLERDIGDDEAGSQLAALEVAQGMRDEGLAPPGDGVWGTPRELQDWRARTAAGDNPFEAWFELVLSDYGRRDGMTVEEAARRLQELPGNKTVEDIPGPWTASGDMAEKLRALQLAAAMEAGEDGEEKGD